MSSKLAITEAEWKLTLTFENQSVNKVFSLQILCMQSQVAIFYTCRQASK